jgi:hypothetical protein
VRGEVEAALAAHFGTPVPLRLVVENGTPPPDEPPAAEPEIDIDPGELVDAGPAVTSVEDRLKEAFPGAQEVEP